MHFVYHLTRGWVGARFEVMDGWMYGVIACDRWRENVEHELCRQGTIIDVPHDIDMKISFW